MFFSPLSAHTDMLHVGNTLLDLQEAWLKNKNYYSICMVKKIEKAFHVKVEVTGALIMPIRSLTIMNIT